MGARDEGAGSNAPPLDSSESWASGGGKGRATRPIAEEEGDAESATAARSTPLPWKSLGLLAFLSLAEQTALNSIGPYLPAMVASFDEIPDGEEGLYVGLLASAFALAQLATNLLWGYLSDRVGRKPTMLLGTSLLTVCFVFFGLCTTYVQLLMVHVAMGLFNGNAAIVPTCLGEITDRSNQSQAFTWLPVIYSLGSITGPALGGLLVGVLGGPSHPFLAPNLLDAALLLASVVVLALWFEETLDTAEPTVADADLGWLKTVRHWFAALGRKGTRGLAGKGRRGSGSTDVGEDGVYPHTRRQLESPHPNECEGLLGSMSSDDEVDDNGKDSAQPKSAFRELANRNTLAVLGTYLVFQLSNISFNSLYPIFAAAPPPTGRNLGPSTIGLSLSFAGLATILFQSFLFQRLKARMGNLGTYRFSLIGMATSMALMPWVGHHDAEPRLGFGTGEAWMYGELGAILLLKNICAVGGLSSVMLLVGSLPSLSLHLLCCLGFKHLLSSGHTLSAWTPCSVAPFWILAR